MLLPEMSSFPVVLSAGSAKGRVRYGKVFCS